MGTDFPSIQKPSSRKRTYYKPQIRTEFEAGYVQSRSKFTRGRWQFELEWKYLPILEFNQLVSHFETNCGDTFSVSSDILYYGSSHNFRYSEDSLSASSSAPGYYSVKVSLEEE